MAQHWSQGTREPKDLIISVCVCVCDVSCTSQMRSFSSADEAELVVAILAVICYEKLPSWVCSGFSEKSGQSTPRLNTMTGVDPEIINFLRGFTETKTRATNR